MSDEQTADEVCNHANAVRVKPLYADGRPLYRCADCDARFTYEDDEPSHKALWGPERMRHDPEGGSRG